MTRNEFLSMRKCISQRLLSLISFLSLSPVSDIFFLSLSLLNRISSPPSSVFTQFNSRFFHVPQRVSLSLPVELGRKEIDKRDRERERETKSEKERKCECCYQLMLSVSTNHE